jgi:predicted Zn-dependent protease
MLPTPEAASIAFAEVTSFVSYFARDAGEPALRLLFADLKGFGEHGADPALESVTGYGLAVWNQRWQRALASMSLPGAQKSHAAAPGRELYRQVRLNDLLREAGKARSAADVIAPSLGKEQREPSVRYRGARALLDVGEPAEARAALGALTEIGSIHGPWFALHGRLLREAGDRERAEEAFRTGIGVDPLSEDVACEGERESGGATTGSAGPKLPEDPARRELCRAVRARPGD